MSDSSNTLPSDTSEPPLLPGEDLTGRDRMAWNVIASWAGHMVFVVAGFIMPRFIDRRLGQEELGVWDFGWSLVSYFGLAQIGIGSSVNRYVARYRAVGDTAGISRAVSSVMLVQIWTSILAFGLALAATGALPYLFNERLGEHLPEAHWVVLLLGASIAVQLLFNVYVGVITGCHRWDLHNFVNAGAHLATLMAMILALSLNGGLPGLAAANLCGVAAGEVARAIVGHHVCPGLRIRLSNARWSQIVEMAVFGGKTVLNSLSRLLLYQTNSMLIAFYLGPAALALYSRPRSLVSHAQTFVNKFGFVLTPVASSLQAAERKEDLRELLVQTGRFAAYMALPMVLFMAIMGDPLLRLWMGPRYEQGLILAVLAIGHLAEMTRQPVINILAGMNMHGRLAIVNVCVGMGSVGLGILCLGVLHWGLLGAALSVAVPLMLVNGLYVPVYASRRLGIGVWSYLARTNRGPLLCAIPFALCLVSARLVFAHAPLLALLSGVIIGGLVLGLLYWQRVVPARIRNKLISRFGRVMGHVASQQA